MRRMCKNRGVLNTVEKTRNEHGEMKRGETEKKEKSEWKEKSRKSWRGGGGEFSTNYGLIRPKEKGRRRKEGRK